MKSLKRMVPMALAAACLVAGVEGAAAGTEAAETEAAEAEEE